MLQDQEVTLIPQIRIDLVGEVLGAVLRPVAGEMEGYGILRQDPLDAVGGGADYSYPEVLVYPRDAFDDVLVLLLVLNTRQFFFDDDAILVLDLAKQRHREGEDDVGSLVDLVIHLVNQLMKVLVLGHREFPEQALEELVVLLGFGF